MSVTGGSDCDVAGPDIDGRCGGGLNLDPLPAALLETIMTKLDVTSLCSLASTSPFFRACVSNFLTFTPNFQLLDLAPSRDLIRLLMPPNPLLKSLKLECDRLDDSAIDILLRPSLNEIHLQNCHHFSGKLITEIGRICKDLRFLNLRYVATKGGRTIDQTALEQLFSGCRHLEVLILYFLPGLYLHPENVGIWDLVSNKLTCLELCHITSEMITQLLIPSGASGQNQEGPQPAHFQNLQNLCLYVPCIDDALVRAVSKVLVSLTHLKLKDSPQRETMRSSDLTNSGLQWQAEASLYSPRPGVESQLFLSSY